ncbi:Gtr1/RagA G protein conserved region-domain-containing protein [Blastocladiella britannica]|nr:Gtr1/RagA G protein conserved region-domain-containing protein [Blastocladiella britannica]
MEIRLELPRVLLMGLRRSGKTSIQKVVFHKMAPNETIFLESTTTVGVERVHSFIQFMIADFPGQIEFTDPSTFDLEAIFGEGASGEASAAGAIIFVIDAQDDYYDALQRLYVTVATASRYNPNMYYEVFIHKVDGLRDDTKIEVQRDIHQRVTDELLDLELLDKIKLSFHLTSIYDHSIYEAFSKVVQKLIPQLPTLENLLNTLCLNSSIEKTFLFDSFTKIYLATDSSPVDVQSYELCSDMIDVMMDLEHIYEQSSSPPPPPAAITAAATTTTTATTATGPIGPGVLTLAPITDRKQGSVIRLSTGIVLSLVQMDKLSLVCLLRAENYDGKAGLLDFNFEKFRDAVWGVFSVPELCKQAAESRRLAATAAAAATNGNGPRAAYGSNV